MPNNSYIVQVTGMRSGAGDITQASVLGNSYNTSVATGNVKVLFGKSDGTAVDVIMGNVTIFSVT